MGSTPTPGTKNKLSDFSPIDSVARIAERYGTPSSPRTARLAKRRFDPKVSFNYEKVYKSSENTTAPLSGAQEVNGLIFVSGQIHMNTKGQLVGSTIEEKLYVVISNVRKILDEAGLTLDDVIRVHLYLTDLKELPELNKVYPKYFKHPLPARTAVGVNA